MRRVGQTRARGDPDWWRRQLKVPRVGRGSEQVRGIDLEGFLTAIDTHLAKLIRKLANPTCTVASYGGLAITRRIYVLRLPLMLAVIRRTCLLLRLLWLWRLLLLLLLLLRELVFCSEPGGKELPATETWRLCPKAAISRSRRSFGSSIVGLCLPSSILASLGMRRLCRRRGACRSSLFGYIACGWMLPLSAPSGSLCNTQIIRINGNFTRGCDEPTKR